MQELIFLAPISSIPFYNLLPTLSANVIDLSTNGTKPLNIFQSILKIQDMSIQLILTETQSNLLLSCFNDFRSLCSMASEFIKLEPLYDKITQHSQVTPEDIKFIHGILETVIRNYRSHLIICETNPGRFPEEVRTHYVEKVTSIINLKNLL